MKTFSWSDNQNREWLISLTFADVRKIARTVGVDFLDPAQSAGVVGLSAERYKLAEALWILSESQAKLKNISQDDFEAGLDVDALATGFDALCEAFIHFAPRPQQAAVRAAVDAQLAAMLEAATKIAEVIGSEEAQAAIATAIGEAVTAAKATLGTSLSGSALSAA